ncbi:MAG TPA: hypothetical protein VG456_26745 [Candidatus Sulfopaludibacter sp.]|jgi:hypothetical protein|nr:hypothetical protein [Candidatus Sulfopaludibacter sp.]
MSSTEKPCARQQELIEEARMHLLRISELTRIIAAAVDEGDDTRLDQLDKEVEMELGYKERAMGALYEHRREHGC